MKGPAARRSTSSGRARGWAVVPVVTALALTAAGGAAGVLAAAAADRPLPVPVLLAVDYLAFATIGAVVTLARPGHRVGPLMLLGGLLAALGGGAVGLAVLGLVDRPGTVAAASTLAVAGAVLRSWGWILATVGVPMFFPDGHLRSARWRWLPRTMAAALVLQTVGTAFGAHAQVDALAGWSNPLSSPARDAIAEPLSALALVLSLVAAGGVIAQLAARWRRGDPRLREQIALLAGAALLALLAPPLSLAGVGGDWLFALCLLPLPVAVGFAVLARGQYDLSVVANRTLVWVTLSAAIVAIYALVIAGVGAILDAADARWLPWVAAAVVAVSLAPLRDALQRTVNRLIFGRWEDPYEVLAGLGRSLAAAADVHRLLADVVAELRTALGLTRVGIRDADGRLLAGDDQDEGPRDGRAGERDDTVVLTAFHRTVGTLHFRAAAPPRAEDRRLLDDVAHQLGGVLHTRSLNAALQRAREHLVLSREEERRRLRRDLHDGLGPAIAGHVIRLDVTLRRLPPDSPVRPDLIALRTEMQGTVADLRRVVEGLRPPALDELGLVGALRQLVARLTAGAPVAVGFEVDRLPALSAAQEVAAYRIVAEAVSNVVRHAAAGRCTVRLTGAPNDVEVAVLDDGCGLGAGRAGGHGLQTMRERAAELGGSLQVRPGVGGAGTCVLARLPGAGGST